MTTAFAGNILALDSVTLNTSATILCGVEIGEDAVVGAGSVVTANVPPRTIVAGNPARVLRPVEDR